MEAKRVKATTHPGRLAYWMRKSFEEYEKGEEKEESVYEQDGYEIIKLRTIGAGSIWQAMKACATNHYLVRPAFGEPEKINDTDERTVFYIEVLKPENKNANNIGS